jgi:nitric oxide reductase NorQ protein
MSAIFDAPLYLPQGDEVALYEAAYAAHLPVMVKGPTGCGKSRFVEYMAHRLDKPLITVACNEDMTASDLVGRFLLDAQGSRWVDGPLTQAARQGAICYLDEVVEARADTTVVIHALTDHRRSLPIDKGRNRAGASGLSVGHLLQPRLPKLDEGPQAFDQAALRGV